MIAVIALTVLSIYGFANYYIARRLWQWLFFRLPSFGLPVYCTVFAVLAGGYILSTVLSSLLPGEVKRVLGLIGGNYLGAFMFLLPLVLLADLVRAAGLGGERWPLIAGIAIVSATAVIMGIGYGSARSLKTTEYTVKADKGAGESLKIAMISDLHLGDVVGASLLSNVVIAINEMEPDIVVFCGDTFDHGPGGVREIKQCEQLLRSITSRYGVYACMGNHDGGFIGLEDEAAAFLERCGITMLRDEALLVKDMFYVVGRKDKSEGQRLSPVALLQDLDKTKPIIVLDHQPEQLSEESAAGADLVLCGHTHKGQIFPIGLITSAIYEVDYGALERDGCTMIVSSGAGTWGPRVRLGTRCEVVSITLEY